LTDIDHEDGTGELLDPDFQKDATDERDEGAVANALGDEDESMTGTGAATAATQAQGQGQGQGQAQVSLVYLLVTNPSYEDLTAPSDHPFRSPCLASLPLLLDDLCFPSNSSKSLHTATATTRAYPDLPIQ
jgi:hypothetical protein